MPAPRRSRRFELTTYLAATFLWSWTLWAPVVPHLRLHGLAGAAPWSYALLLLGAYGPTLMAVMLAWRDEGRVGARRLLAKLLDWRAQRRWYAIAFLLPVVLPLGGLAILSLRGGWSGGLDLSRWYLAPAALLVSLPFGPLAEELGWRGHLFPRLAERHGPLAAGALVGLAWTAWHWPLFWAPAGTSISGLPVTPESIGWYLSMLVGYSICLAWVLERTSGRVTLAVVFHLSLNTEIHRFFLSGLPGETRWEIERLSVLPLWILVALLLITGALRSNRAIQPSRSISGLESPTPVRRRSASAAARSDESPDAARGRSPSTS